MHHGKKHSLMMLLCIGAPIAAMLLLSFGGNIAGKWSWALFLLCPLMHVAMMWGMHRGSGNGHAHHEDLGREATDGETAVAPVPAKRSCH